jgi:hypothetical protein
MKKILLICLLFFHLIVNAQSGYELYRCDQIQFRTKDDNGSWSEWTAKEANMIIRNCVTEDRVEFNNTSKTIVYIIDLLSTSQDYVDDDGDKYNIKRLQCYDQDGLKCVLVITDWINLPYRNFTIQYSDTEIVFRCKMFKDNTPSTQL